jgi:hypothetical protein
VHGAFDCGGHRRFHSPRAHADPSIRFISDIPQRKTKAVILTAVKSFAVAARLAKGFSPKHPAARGDDSGT